MTALTQLGSQQKVNTYATQPSMQRRKQFFIRCFALPTFIAENSDSTLLILVSGVELKPEKGETYIFMYVYIYIYIYIHNLTT
jgi:hypothetical protein